MFLIQSSHLPEAHAYDDSGFYFSTEGLWRPDYLHILTYAIVSIIYLCIIKIIHCDLIFLHKKFYIIKNYSKNCALISNKEQIHFNHSIFNTSLITSVTFARRISIEGQIHLVMDKLPSIHPVLAYIMLASLLESIIEIGCENKISMIKLCAIFVILKIYDFL